MHYKTTAKQHCVNTNVNKKHHTTTTTSAATLDTHPHTGTYTHTRTGHTRHEAEAPPRRAYSCGLPLTHGPPRAAPNTYMTLKGKMRWDRYYLTSRRPCTHCHPLPPSLPSLLPPSPRLCFSPAPKPFSLLCSCPLAPAALSLLQATVHKPDNQQTELRNTPFLSTNFILFRNYKN